MSQQHYSVMLSECIDGLAIKPDGIYVDCTFGRGGHSRAILAKLSAQGRLIAFDRDPQAIASAAEFADDPRFVIHHQPFSELQRVAELESVVGQVDGILMDLGVSSPQLDQAERGFSFMRDGPLDMRMDTTRGQSAAQWLAHADEQDISWVLHTFGEEKQSRKIARHIVKVRVENPITTTLQLAGVIEQVMPRRWDDKKHPATRSFQAIRIFINSELEEVETALKASLSVLKPSGRLAVISFHSLEDRIVKQFMRKHSKGEAVPRGLPLTEAQINKDVSLKLIGKAISASEQELAENVRSRSAMLRVAERVAK